MRLYQAETRPRVAVSDKGRGWCGDASQWHFAVTFVVGLVVACQVGCLGLASQILHVAGVHLIPAQYEGLNDSVVAVITVTDSTQYTNDSAARDLSRRVGSVLVTEGKDITLVREDLVQQYRDRHGYETSDYSEIGKEVQADKVLVIEMSSLSLRDGATLFQGSADVHLQVVDVESGDTVYQDDIDQFTFPKSAGQHTSETTEKRFRGLYLRMLAGEIGRRFHPFDPNDLVADDVLIASQ